MIIFKYSLSKNTLFSDKKLPKMLKVSSNWASWLSFLEWRSTCPYVEDVSGTVVFEQSLPVSDQNLKSLQPL